MPEDSHSFSSTRTRLEEIVSQVRKKDTSLEKSLDLLEEGVRLANQCTELIDHADWEAAGAPASDGAEGDGDSPDDISSGGADDNVTAQAEEEGDGPEPSSDEPDAEGQDPGHDEA